MLPSHDPLQVGEIKVVFALIAKGSVINTVEIFWHPIISVVVTVWVPTHKAVTATVVLLEGNHK
jgi:hypothetical protein